MNRVNKINWEDVKSRLTIVPVLHFKAGDNRISIAREDTKTKQIRFVVFINYRLVKTSALKATPLERQVLNPVFNRQNNVMSYHFRDSQLENVIDRLKTVVNIRLSEHQVEA